MGWQQLIVRLAAAELPRVEALLQLAGARALSIADDADFPLLEPGVGEMPVWPTVVVRALFAQDFNLPGLTAMLRPILGVERELLITPLTDDDWMSAWLQRIAPREFGADFWVVPADSPDEPLRFRQLRLHMGLAFGTGQHATTALCLKWLAAQALSGLRVLDYGCGSGILALAALRLGASYAWAVDNDPQALVATRDNARLNELQHLLWVGPPEEQPQIVADLILANIVAGTLTDLASLFAAQLKPRSMLVLSGILSRQRSEIETAYAPYFDEFHCSDSDGWICLIGRRKIDSQPLEWQQRNTD